MVDIIVILTVLLLVGAAGLYIYKAKKAGQKCIGCPYSKTCASKGCGCGCGGAEK